MSEWSSENKIRKKAGPIGRYFVSYIVRADDISLYIDDMICRRSQSDSIEIENDLEIER